MQNINKIEDICGGIALRKFLETITGKPMRLHMSSAADKNNTFQVTSGFVKEVRIHFPSENRNVGFSIQLMDRKGKEYSNTENFFGSFEYFEIKESAISTMVRVQYRDGSYFYIEVFM